MTSLRTGFARKPDIQLQSEAAECGLACLAMIATSHGHEVDLRGLRHRFSTSLLGVTLGRLMQQARDLGFATRALRLEPEELPQLKLPCVLHVDVDHFIVLSACKRNGFQILDPATGTRTFGIKEMRARFTGVALELTPGAGFVTRKRKRSDVGVFRMLGMPASLPAAIGQILLLALVIEVFALATPFLGQWAVDEALVGADSGLLFTITAGLLLVGLMQTATEALREFALLHLSASLGLQWFTRMSSTLLSLPLSYFEKRQLGGITTRIETLGVIQHTVSNGLVESIVDGLMAIGTLVMMLLYSAKLACRKRPAIPS